MSAPHDHDQFDRWLTPTQLAAALDVSTRTVHTWANAGHVHRRRRDRKILLSEALAYIETRDQHGFPPDAPKIGTVEWSQWKRRRSAAS